MVLGLYSRCIWKWRQKKTRRRSKVGKRMPMEFLYSCVSTISLASRTDSLSIDRFILRCCCIVDLSVHSGPATELTRHFELLPCKYLSDSRGPQHFDFPPFFPASVHSAKLCHLGQLALVPELGDRHYLCATCDAATTVGTEIPQGHPTALQPTQESADPIILCRRG